MKMDGTANAVNIGTGYFYTSNDADFSSNMPMLIKAAEGKTSIWVACIQYAGTLDLTDRDSITCTFGFEYLG